MKRNNIVIILIVIIMIGIITGGGFLVVTIINDKQPTGSQNIAQEKDTNQQISGIGGPINQEQNAVTNQQTENMVFIEPIIKPNNNTQPKENTILQYYYSQLDDTAKIVYEKLKQEKDKMLSGTYKIDYGTQFNTLLNSEGGQAKITKAIQDAWDAFMYDNVELFYIDTGKISNNIQSENIGGIVTYKVSIGPNNKGSYYQDIFKTQKQVQEAKNYLEDLRKQISDQIANDSVYYKVAKVHNWLVEQLNYEYTQNAKEQYTIYGALANRKAVCEGYARAFKYLMDGAGVPCVLVSGTGTNSNGEIENHAWNYVQINESWYAIDVTWDDPIITGEGEVPSDIKFKYFLKGSEEFKIDHKEDGSISENGKQFKFPTLATQNYQN